MKAVTGLLCCLLLFWGRGTAAENAEERLVKYLRTKVHPLIRPMNSTDETVRVRMFMYIKDFRMDDMTETMDVVAWVYLGWYCPILKWKKEDFEGIKWIMMPSEKVWHPSVELLNKRVDEAYHNKNVYIARWGRVGYWVQARYKIPCSLDLTYFPFDTQTCYMNFSSSLYNEKQVKVMPYRRVWRSWWMDRNGNHWKMLSSGVTRYLVDSRYPKEAAAGLKYNLASVKLVIQRLSAYYTFVYVGPAVIVSLLTVCVFLLPPVDPQKTTLGAALLIGYSLIFIELGTILPPIHANVPLLDKYYMAMFVLLVMSVAFTVLLDAITRRSEGVTHPPPLLRTIVIDYMGRCLCMPFNPVEYGRKVEAGISNVNLESTAATTPTTATTANTSTKQSEVIGDWLHIGAIFDRLLLFVYIALIIVITATILKGHP